MIRESSTTRMGSYFRTAELLIRRQLMSDQNTLHIFNSAKKVSKSLCENFDTNVEEKNCRSK